jgi:hypothetical protein
MPSPTKEDLVFHSVPTADLIRLGSRAVAGYTTSSIAFASGYVSLSQAVAVRSTRIPGLTQD